MIEEVADSFHYTKLCLWEIRGRTKLKREATDLQEILQHMWLVRWCSEHRKPYKELR